VAPLQPVGHHGQPASSLLVGVCTSTGTPCLMGPLMPAWAADRPQEAGQRPQLGGAGRVWGELRRVLSWLGARRPSGLHGAVQLCSQCQRRAHHPRPPPLPHLHACVGPQLLATLSDPPVCNSNSRLPRCGPPLHALSCLGAAARCAAGAGATHAAPTGAGGRGGRCRGRPGTHRQRRQLLLGGQSVRPV